MQNVINMTEQENIKHEIEDIEPTEKELTEVQGLLHRLPETMLVEALVERQTTEGSASVLMQSISQQYSGPIPPPKMLNDYNHIQSDFAERIVKMAESEQNHRQELEKIAVNGAISKDTRSQNYALVCVLFIAFLCGGLIYTGHDIAGSVLGGSTLVGLAALFITGRRDNTNKKTDSEQE